MRFFPTLTKAEIFAYFLILGILLILATFRLTEAPPTWYDEGLIVQPAINLVQHGVLRVQTAPGVFISPSFISSGYPIFYPVSLAFKFFAVGILQARSVMVVYLILLTLVFIAFSKKLFSKKDAFFATLLLISFPPLYGNGKNVLGEVPGLFLFFLSLYFFYKLESSGYTDKRYWILGGLASGLCVAAKPVFLILAPAILLSAAIFYKKITWNWRMIALFFASALVPILIWLQTQFGGGDSLSNTLTYYANPYSLGSIAMVIAKNFIRFFTETSPLYLFLFILVWALAIFIRIKNKIYISFSETVALFFTTFIVLFYLRTPGWYRYFFPAQIVALCFFPNSLRVISESLRNAMSSRIWRINYIYTSILFVLFAFQMYQTLFHSWVADAYDRHSSQNLAEYFSKINKSQSVFLYNVPDIVIFLHTSNYYQALQPTETMWVGADQFANLIHIAPDLIVINSHDKAVLPQAIWDSYRLDANIEGFTVLKKN